MQLDVDLSPPAKSRSKFPDSRPKILKFPDFPMEIFFPDGEKKTLFLRGLDVEFGAKMEMPKSVRPHVCNLLTGKMGKMKVICELLVNY